MIAGLKRVGHLLTKELIELRSDPRLFGIVIMAPIIQLFVLGYAATTDVKDIPLLVVDGDRSSVSRQLIERFEASSNFYIVDVVSGDGAIEDHLSHGTAWMALTIPAGLGANVGLLVLACAAAFVGAFAGARLLAKTTYESVRAVVLVMLVFVGVLLGAGVI